MKFSNPFLYALVLTATLSACGKNMNQVKDDPLSCDKIDVKLKAASESRTQSELATYQLLTSNTDASKKADAVTSLLEIEKTFTSDSSAPCNKPDGTQRTAEQKDDVSTLLQTALDDLKAGRAVSAELLHRLNPQAEDKLITDDKSALDQATAAWNTVSSRLEAECGLILEIDDADAQGKKAVQPKDRDALDASIKQASEAKDYPTLNITAGDKTLPLPNVLKSLGEIIASLSDEMIQSLTTLKRDPADGTLIRAYLVDLNKTLTDLDQKLRKHEAIAASVVKETK